jgi:hypothetical protein
MNPIICAFYCSSILVGTTPANRSALKRFENARFSGSFSSSLPSLFGVGYPFAVPGRSGDESWLLLRLYLLLSLPAESSEFSERPS